VSEAASAGESGDPDSSPRSRFVRALGVPRNGKIGVALGVAFATAVYLLFVVWLPQSDRSSPLLIVLAFVIAVSTALLVATALTVRNVARMTADLPKWIRRGGVAGIVGGAAWVAASLPAVAVTAGAGVGDATLAVAGFLYPLPPLLILPAAWAVHARNRHTGAYPRLPAGLADSIPGVRPDDLAGLVGGTAFVLTATGLLLLARTGAVRPAAFLGVPTGMTPGAFFTVNAIALLGTSLLGAGALRAGVGPIAGPLALLFALPAGLAGLTAVSVLGVEALSTSLLAVALGLPWATMGRVLSEGGGVPPVERFRPPVVRQGAGSSDSGVVGDEEERPDAGSGAD